MINVIKGKYPHVGWVDLEQNGIAIEVAIVKNDPSGLFFIRLDQLDRIDKQRIFRVISNRNAHLYELWDLMSTVTLGNGANALEYFHQFVRVLTPSGRIVKPSEGQRGLAQVPQMMPIQTRPEVETSQETITTKAVSKPRTPRKTPTRRKTVAK